MQVLFLAWFDFPFHAGAIAQRNDWMVKIQEKSRLVIYSWTVISVALQCFLYIYYGLCKGIIFTDPTNTGYFILTAFITGVLWKGIMQVGICLGVSVFFMDFFERKYWCTPFFSKAMYTAYIIQHVTLLFGLKVVFVMLEGTGNIVHRDETENLDSMSITNENLLVPCYFLVAAITLIIDWPLAYLIQSIPGFSEVL